jgi:hypothetical protein
MSPWASANASGNKTDATLLNQAIECAAAADAYVVVGGLQSGFVPYLLLGIAMECALKGYAVTRGATEANLNEIGHDLVKALARAESDGFNAGLSDEERASVELLGRWHENKASTYPQVLGHVIPNPRIIRTVADRLIGAVFVAIWGPELYQEQRVNRPVRGLSVAADANYDGSVQIAGDDTDVEVWELMKCEDS